MVGTSARQQIARWYLRRCPLPRRARNRLRSNAVRLRHTVKIEKLRPPAPLRGTAVPGRDPSDGDRGHAGRADRSWSWSRPRRVERRGSPRRHCRVQAHRREYRHADEIDDAAADPPIMRDTERPDLPVRCPVAVEQQKIRHPFIAAGKSDALLAYNRNAAHQEPARQLSFEARGLVRGKQLRCRAQMNDRRAESGGPILDQRNIGAQEQRRYLGGRRNCRCHLRCVGQRQFPWKLAVADENADMRHPDRRDRPRLLGRRDLIDLRQHMPDPNPQGGYRTCRQGQARRSGSRLPP